MSGDWSEHPAAPSEPADDEREQNARRDLRDVPEARPILLNDERLRS